MITPGRRPHIPPRTVLLHYLISAVIGAFFGTGVYALQVGAEGINAVAVASCSAALAASATILLLQVAFRRERIVEAALLRSIIESTVTGVWILDASYHTTWLNGKMREILGRDPDPGVSWLEWFHKDMRDEIEKASVSRLRLAASMFESTLCAADGRSSDVMISTIPMGDRKGGERGIIAFVTDLSEQRARQDKEAQSERRATVHATVARLNHKINNALMVIRGQAEVTMRRDPDAPTSPAFQRVIDQVDVITRELRALSEIREVKMESYLGDRSILSVEGGSEDPDEDRD